MVLWARRQKAYTLSGISTNEPQEEQDPKETRHPLVPHLPETASFCTPAHPSPLLGVSNPSELQSAPSSTMAALRATLLDLWAQGPQPKGPNCMSLSRFQSPDRLSSDFPHTRHRLLASLSQLTDGHPWVRCWPWPSQRQWGREDHRICCCTFWAGKHPEIQ